MIPLVGSVANFSKYFFSKMVFFHWSLFLGKDHAEKFTVHCVCFSGLSKFLKLKLGLELKPGGVLWKEGA